MRPSNQPPVVLSQDESDHLFETIHKGSHKARVITRARILTKLAMGLKRGEIGQALDVGLTTVDNTPKKFNQGGLQSALSELPRPGQAPKLDAKQAAQITAIACSKAPDGHDHWTLRLLAGKVVELGFADSFSHEAARQLLKKTNSSPGKSRNGAFRKSTRSS